MQQTPTNDQHQRPIASEIFDGADLNFSEALKQSKKLGSTRFLPYVAGADLRKALRNLIVIQIGKPKKAENLKTMIEDAESHVSIFGDTAKKLLAASASQIGTHTSKNSNVNSSIADALLADADLMASAAANPFVGSATTRVNFRFASAGNAADIRAQRFLSNRIEYDGSVIDFVEDFVEQGIVYRTLIEMGIDADLLETISANLKGQPAAGNGADVGELTKQLLWPTADGDVIVTPTSAFPMQPTVSGRRRAVLDRGSRLPVMSVQVGGTKPQNAGLVNSDCMGRHLLLFSLPPRARSHAERRDFRFNQYGKVSLGYVSKNHPAVESFASATRDPINNARTRERLEKSLRRLVGIVLIPYREAGKLYQEDEFTAEDKIDKALALLFEDGFRSLSNESRDQLTADVATAVERIGHGVIFSDELHRLARNAAEAELMRIFR